MTEHMASVRRYYGVPAYRGAEVIYRGYKHPMAGHIISCTGSHLYIRLHDGRRFGPLHPTSEMDYGDGRDYTAECNAVIEIKNEWLNGRLDGLTAAKRIAAVRSGGDAT